MFVCPNCGANINFDPGKQLLHCDFCDSEFSPDAAIQKDDAEEQTYTETEADESSETGYREYTTTIYTCKECGGEILANDNTVATFCSYCGASTVLSSRISKERAPEYIIPFKITKQQCADLYKKHLSKALYAPGYMKEDVAIDKFRGIYMPYWVYDFAKDGHLSFNAKEDHRRGDYIIHTNYSISTDVQADYNGLSYDASSQFSDTLSEAIAPFDFSQAVDFNTSYMSGFYADAADADASLYEGKCKGLVTNEIYSKITADRAITGKRVDTSAISSFAPNKTETRMGYFPVWFLSCRHKDRLTYAVVNGQTGEVAMDVPIDYGKYIISSLLMAVVFFLILAFVPSTLMRPAYMLVVAVIFAIVSMVIICNMKNKIYARENNLDDAGLAARKSKEASATDGVDSRGAGWQAHPQATVSQAKPSAPAYYTIFAIIGAVAMFFFANVMGVIIFFTVIYPLIKNAKENSVNKKILEAGLPKAKAPGHQKLLLCLKPLIGVVLSVLVWMFSPAADEYYYIAAIFCIAGVLLSFFDITSLHNKLSTRPLPQFDKRGGDE